MAGLGNLGAAGAAGFDADIHIGAGAAGAIGHHPYASVYPGVHSAAGAGYHHPHPMMKPYGRCAYSSYVLVLFILLVIILRGVRI